MRALPATLLAGLVAFAPYTPALAQADGMITPNYKDADLSQIIEAVSAVTGKNFIVDPRVRAQVTMLSSTPMTPPAFYEAFLSILQVHGFVAVPAGDVIKIIPDANARQVPGSDLPSRVSPDSDEIVTQVVGIRNVSAAQLVPILRPLIPQYGHLAAYPASNMLIISDRAANVNRMMRIIERIDQAGDSDIDVIPMQHASAVEVVRIVNTLYAGAAAEGAGAPSVKMVADERTNSVLVSGEASQRLRLRTLITHLDTPLESGGDTQVRYLRYADAEKIAQKLREQIQGIAAAAEPGAGGAVAGAPSPAVVSSVAGTGDKSVTIWAEPDGAAEGDAVRHVHRRPTRHPPSPGAGRGHPRRDSGREGYGPRHQLADPGPRLRRQHAAGRRVRAARGRHGHRPDTAGHSQPRERHLAAHGPDSRPRQHRGRRHQLGCADPRTRGQG